MSSAQPQPDHETGSPDPLQTWREDVFWNDLVGVIGTGDVVPVVGEDLLSIPGNRNLYQDLAALYCKETAPDPDLLGLSRFSPAAASFREAKRFEVNSKIKAGYYNLVQGLPIPEPLRALARITDFHLFVSTTFDDLLQRALNERPGGLETKVISYSPAGGATTQEINQKLKSGSPVVFKLFGNIADDDFALSEADKIEFLHRVRERPPARIISELQHRPLLMIGNSLPGWLTPVVLRMLRKDKLDDSTSPRQYLSEDNISRNRQLQFFFQKFSLNTTVVDRLSPSEFAIELFSRWQNRAPEPSIDRPAEGGVFISYCATNRDNTPSRDRQMALALYEALVKADVPAWLDKRTLRGGDDYRSEIKRFIKNSCRLFVVIASQLSEQAYDQFVQVEWNAAKERTEGQGDVRFVIPIRLGAVNLEHPNFRGLFDSKHALKFGEGGITDELIQAIKSSYEENVRKMNS
jgi:hypothetical protein